MNEIMNEAFIIGGDDLVFSSQELTEPLRNTQKIFVIVEPLGPWVRATIDGGRTVDDQGPKLSLLVSISKNISDICVNEFCVARPMFMADNLKLTKRVIAGTDLMDLQAGLIAETPTIQNNRRYLVLFDNGSALYSTPDYVFPIIGQTLEPWYDSEFLPKELGSVLNEYNKTYSDINRAFFLRYPHKDSLHVVEGQKVKLYRDGQLVQATVTQIDCDIMTVLYKDQHKEMIYCGSHRLSEITDNLSNQIPSIKPFTNLNNELKALLNLYERITDELLNHGIVSRPTARKSTAAKDAKDKEKQYQVISVQGPRVSEDLACTSADEDDFDPMLDHKCTVECFRQDFKTELDYENLVEEFRDVSDLRVPLLLGWKRYVKKARKNRHGIIYEAPCGKCFSSTLALKWCLYNTRSKLDLDYFCYDKDVQLNRDDCTEMRYLYRDPNIAVDKDRGLPAERKNIALINIYNAKTIPRYFVYCPDVQPYRTLELIRFKIDRNFKSGCDCTTDCMDRVNCSCHRYNEVCAGVEYFNRGTLDPRFNYQNKRLFNQVATGIFECNEFCACSSKCPNRVVQNGIRARFQIQMTIGKGWGVHTLDDIPAGAFLSTYAGHLHDDADQVGENDMYLADLDFISVNQNTKEIFSDDDEGVDTNLEKYPQVDIERVFENARLEDEEGLDSENGPVKVESDVPIERKMKPQISREHDVKVKQESKSRIKLEPIFERSEECKGDVEVVDLTEDDPGAPCSSVDDELSRYPKRSRRKRPEKREIEAPMITTNSRRPELRVNDGRFKNIHSILGSRDYTIDSRFIGNLGRFYNHSCSPNAFSQCVFIDTHDLRFPVVAFFAQRNIKAMEEITWNYNYKVGSLPNRVIKCNCGSLKCVGRIL